MVVLPSISMPFFAASFSSLSTQKGRASRSLPSATAVRHATVVAITVPPCSRQRSAMGLSVVVLPEPAAPSTIATRPPAPATARIAAVCSSLSG